MKLDAEFVRLPLRFDAERLAAEVATFAESDWRPHPHGYPGNSALPLVAVNGDPADDATKGIMRPTPHLDRAPYLRQVLAALGTVIGRTRLMRLHGDAEATPHVDVNYYWFERARVHVPIVTTDDVRFIVGDSETHMAPGEAWVFDTWRTHNVLNPGAAARIHLVADTVGSASFWDLVDRGERVVGGTSVSANGSELVPWRPNHDPALRLEHVNQPVVMTPWELDRLADRIRREVVLETAADEAAAVEYDRLLLQLRRDWRARWAVHGAAPSGHEQFRLLRESAYAALARLEGRLRVDNGQELVAVTKHVLGAALNPDLLEQAAPPPRRRPGGARRRPRLEQPIFVVSPPRSGSTLLFETLSQSPDLWTIGGESHALIEGIPQLHPAAHGWASNRLTEADADGPTVGALTDRFAAELRDRAGSRASGDRPYLLLEKTPKNALRVPFLAAAFPDSRFVYLYRDPMDTLASMAEAWRSGRFVTYPDLPGWSGPPWSMLLVPGWKELDGMPIPELVANQWLRAARVLLDDLEALGPGRWCVASYGNLVQDPQAEVDRLCRFLEIGWDRELTAPLPNSRTTVTPPDPEKSKHNAEELQPFLPLVGDVSERARELFSRPPGPRRPTTAAPVDGERPQASASAFPPTPAQVTASAQAPAVGAEGGFQSTATTSFPRVLAGLHASLLVSTYQSGRLIVFRADGGELNTHFRSFESPMGIAVDRGRLVLGTRRHVWDYRDQPAVARKLEPAGKHDACYLPRRSHVTGDVRIHELVVVDGEVWFVNTLFSCLATLDDDHSFVPRWRPPFVSALAPEDRCHLNGVALVDGRIKYVSALGTSDDAHGWRQNKAAGGVIVDVPSGEIVVRGLCMPHSPRWHDGRLWILESGKGSLGVVDPERGEVTTVATTPGFTRGLTFAGHYAFVGLSQVRETLFEGVPIKEATERTCGVWVVDIRSGQTVAYLRFEGIVQEIFDVQLLPHRFPDIGEPGSDLVAGAFVLPQDALAEVPAELRAPD